MGKLRASKQHVCSTGYQPGCFLVNNSRPESIDLVVSLIERDETACADHLRQSCRGVLFLTFTFVIIGHSIKFHKIPGV